MRFVQIGFGIFMLSGVAAFGCGGGDTANNPAPGTGGKGGSAGSGGATGGSAGTGTTGGTAGTGGATGGSSGTGTGGSAGGPTGGGAGKGGGAGTGGSAGTGGNNDAGADSGGQGGGGSNDACPATAPDDMDECDNDVNPGNGDEPCTYMGAQGTTTCSCTGFMNPTWNCQTLSCPMMEPDDGDMCSMMTNPGNGDDPCVYRMVECTCAGGMGGPGGGMAQWDCSAPAMCPDMEPDDGDMCDTDTDPTAMDGGCEYQTTTCVCQGFGGGGQQWNCGTCPAMAPDDNEDCDNMVNAFCAYPSGNCTCGNNDQWNCMN